MAIADLAQVAQVAHRRDRDRDGRGAGVHDHRRDRLRAFRHDRRLDGVDAGQVPAGPAEVTARTGPGGHGAPPVEPAVIDHVAGGEVASVEGHGSRRHPVEGTLAGDDLHAVGLTPQGVVLACHLDGHLVRLRAARGEVGHGHARRGSHELRGQLDLRRRHETEDVHERERPRLLRDGRHDLLVAVSEDERLQGGGPIEVLAALGVPRAHSAPVGHDPDAITHGALGARWRVGHPEVLLRERAQARGVPRPVLTHGPVLPHA